MMRRMVQVMREVRFSPLGPVDRPVGNSWAGWPPAEGVGPWLALEVVAAGEPDPRTGYLVSISVLDDLVRRYGIPAAAGLLRAGPCPPERLALELARVLAVQTLPRARWVRWRLRTTPLVSCAVEARSMSVVELGECFEFSAAHRLHCPALSDEENLRTFGKCNNPAGHGHNYQLEVVLRGEPDAATGVLLPPGELHRVVRQQVIDRFDHRHLNEDCAEFAELNPSVENIAAVIWRLLAGRFGRADLARVRVWETPKTWAECSG